MVTVGQIPMRVGQLRPIAMEQTHSQQILLNGAMKTTMVMEVIKPAITLMNVRTKLEHPSRTE